MTSMDQSSAAPIALPTTRSGLFDPPAELGRLREQEPIRRLAFPGGEVAWLVTDYAIGRLVLGDQRFGKHLDDPQMHDFPAFAAAMGRLHEQGDPSMAALRAGNFAQMDPPEHTRFRQLLAPYFPMGRLRADLQAVIEGIVEDCMQEMEAAGPPVDLVSTFAGPVPLRSICHMLGVPASGHEIVYAFTSSSLGHEPDADAMPTVIQATGELMREVIAHKRAHPADDLLSRLVVGGELTDEEIVGVGMGLAAAGSHTTSAMLAHGTFALLSERERWATLVADPDGIEKASEELLRYLTVNQLDAHTRTAREDVELGGVRIAKGERVQVSLPAVNRDSERFEEPDKLDIARDARGHLTLGHGIHICLGQHLARLEMHVAFAGLTRRFPELHLAVPADEVPMPPGSAPLYSPLRLPVAW